MCWCYIYPLTDKLLVQCDAGLYHFINQGCLTVDGMSDKEEMDIADVCSNTLTSPRLTLPYILMCYNKNNFPSAPNSLFPLKESVCERFHVENRMLCYIEMTVSL